MQINLAADLDRRHARADLAIFSPIAMVIRAAKAKITENWTVSPL